MTDLILSLIRTGGPMTTAGIVRELTVLKLSGCSVKLPTITVSGVEVRLDTAGSRKDRINAKRLAGGLSEGP